MKKTKILAIIQLPPPIHGASISNARIAKILKEDINNQLEVLRLNYADNFEKMHTNAIVKVIYSLKVYVLYLFKLCTFRPDYVYISFAPFGAGFLRDFITSIVANLFGVKKVKAHLHGTGLSINETCFTGNLYRTFFKFVDLILISKALYPDVKNYINEDKVHYIQNTVDTPDIYKNQLGERCDLIFIANLDERKGVLKIIDIFASLKKHKQFHASKLNIVGSDTYLLSKDQVVDYIESNYPNLCSFIVLHGAKYFNEKSEILNASDIFVYPTAHDAAPLVVLEAQAHGLPVVCSSQGALTDIVKDGETGFVIEHYEVSDYVKSIMKVKSNYKVLSRNSRQLHLKRHSNSALIKNLEDLFNE